MLERLPERLARCGLPEPRLLPGAEPATDRQRGATVGAERNGSNRTLMGEGLRPLVTRGRIAQIGHFAGTCQGGLSVRAEGHGRDRTDVYHRLAHGLAGGHIPQLGYA